VAQKREHDKGAKRNAFAGRPRLGLSIGNKKETICAKRMTIQKVRTTVTRLRNAGGGREKVSARRNLEEGKRTKKKLEICSGRCAHYEKKDKVGSCPTNVVGYTRRDMTYLRIDQRANGAWRKGRGRGGKDLP